jgi:hypothetical protein
VGNRVVLSFEHVYFKGVAPCTHKIEDNSDLSSCHFHGAGLAFGGQVRRIYPKHIRSPLHLARRIIRGIAGAPLE